MIVLAIPTIDARPGRAQETAEKWQRHTCQPMHVCITTAGESWAAGLNDAWAQTRDLNPTVFICGSDDMVPGGDYWLPAALQWLNQRKYPAPRVNDPRFTNWGGYDHPVPDGTPSQMSTLPILRGDWLDTVFPLPEDLHYFADNLIAVKLAQIGVDCVACPSSVIVHEHAMEGRGAGHGDENTRLFIDTVRYSRVLGELGIDRASLPEKQRGGLWQDVYIEHGKTLGA